MGDERRKRCPPLPGAEECKFNIRVRTKTICYERQFVKEARYQVNVVNLETVIKVDFFKSKRLTLMLLMLLNPPSGRVMELT